MNKFYLFLLVLLFSGITSCDKDESNDDPRPDLTNAVTIISPEAQDSFPLIEDITLEAQIEPSLLLRRVTFYLTDPDGIRTMAKERFIHYDNPAQKEYVYSIGVGRENIPGKYTVTLEVLDYEQKLYRDSVSVMLHNPTLSLQDFIKAFNFVNVFSALDWYGYDMSEGIKFDESIFELSMYIIADTEMEYGISEKEWQSFSTDFGLGARAFSEIDLNKNADIDNEEFNEALLSMNVFKNWDLDEDAIINDSEMATGVFNGWDQNQNELLSEREYHDKFYTYLKRQD